MEAINRIEEDEPIELMCQTKNKDAFIVQMLVRNYLENENKETNIHLYGELINDIDAFNSELENIRNLNIKFKSKNPKYVSPKSIKAFLELRDIDNDKLENKYVSTTDVKYSLELKFKDVLPVLMKVKYPINTSVHIIYVSSDTGNYKQPIMTENITIFNESKQQFMELSYDKQYNIINNLINDTKTFNKMSFIEAIMTSINMMLTNSLKQNYKHNISYEEADTFINNLSNCQIRELTLEQLIKQPMNAEVLFKRELRIYN